MKILNQKWLMQLREEAEGDGAPEGGAPAEPPAAPEINLDAVLGLVDDDLRGEFTQTMKDVKDIPGLLKTAVSAQRMVGNSIRVPSEDAPEEVMEKFYEKLKGVKGVVIAKDADSLNASLGVPDKAEDYKVDLAGLPEEIQISQSELDAKRAEWHALGLTPAQAERAAQRWVEAEKQGFEQWQASVNEAEKAIRQKYGAAFEEKMGLVDFVAKNAVDPDDLEFLKATGALNRPGVVDILVKLGEQLQDNGSIEAARRTSAVLPPDEARERIAEIKAHPGYFDAKHPEHKQLVAKAARLYEMANQ